MNIFQNEERLVQVLSTLAEHRDEIKNFYHAILYPIVNNRNDRQSIRDIFVYSVSERRGASLERGREAVHDFDEGIDCLLDTLEQEIHNDAAVAHCHLFEGLCKFRNVNQKIAAMFLEFMVVYLGRWPELRPHLFIPVDNAVLKILGDKLQVYCGPWKEVPSIHGRLCVYNGRQPSAQNKRFLNFQEELGDICKRAHVPRIFADSLWFVGYIFCRQFPLCDRCWIGRWCQQRLQGKGAVRLKRDLALLRVTKEKKVTERFSFADIGFCGMWSEREDMANSSQWVIKQRRGWTHKKEAK